MIKPDGPEPQTDDLLTARRLRALGQPLRLAIWRHLLRAGPEGLAAGTVQDRLGLPASTLSHHLKAMEAAGLLRRARDGNALRCIADFAAMQGLVDHLAAECCADTAPPQGRSAP